MQLGLGLESSPPEPETRVGPERCVDAEVGGRERRSLDLEGSLEVVRSPRDRGAAEGSGQRVVDHEARFSLEPSVAAVVDSDLEGERDGAAGGFEIRARVSDLDLPGREAGCALGVAFQQRVQGAQREAAVPEGGAQSQSRDDQLVQEAAPKIRWRVARIDVGDLQCRRLTNAEIGE
jgi:hypothetical protein